MSMAMMNTTTPTNSRFSRYAYGLPARMLSFLLALGVTGLVIALPNAFAPAGIHSVRHDMLTLMMLGIAAGFVHGVGFIPENIGWKILFGPWLGWPLMIGGLVFSLSAV